MQDAGRAGSDRQRLRRRRAWGCDCDGVSHLRHGREHDPGVAQIQKHIENDTGVYSPTCPFRGLSDPLVLQTIHAYRGITSDAPGVYFPDVGSMPNVLREALTVFDGALRSAKESRRRREDEERESKRKSEAAATRGRR